MHIHYRLVSTPYTCTSHARAFTQFEFPPPRCAVGVCSTHHRHAENTLKKVYTCTFKNKLHVPTDMCWSVSIPHLALEAHYNALHLTHIHVCQSASTTNDGRMYVHYRPPLNLNPLEQYCIPVGIHTQLLFVHAYILLEDIIHHTDSNPPLPQKQWWLLETYSINYCQSEFNCSVSVRLLKTVFSLSLNSI